MPSTATVPRQRLVAFLDGLLDAHQGQDYCPNGLQVEGKAEIRKVVTGVSACAELFDQAIEAGADAVLVHHGLFWEGAPRSLTGYQFQRVARLIDHRLNLLAYHLPLDRHPEVGNNALAARALGLIDLEPIGYQKDGLATGFGGRFPESIAIADLTIRVRNLFQQEPLVLGKGPNSVNSLAVISGGAQREFEPAIKAGYDAFLTGEASEWVTNIARETERYYFAAGHYATERLGIQKLGEVLQREFGLEVEFIEIPNPV